MLGGDNRCFLLGGGEHCSASELVGPSKETAGTLMDCGCRFVAYEFFVPSSYLQMVVQIVFHVFKLQALEKRSSGNP